VLETGHEVGDILEMGGEEMIVVGERECDRMMYPRLVDFVEYDDGSITPGDWGSIPGYTRERLRKQYRINNV